MVDGLHISDPFRVRADVFIGAVLSVLTWAVSVKRAKKSERQLRLMLPFEAVGKIVQQRILPAPKGRGVTWLDIAEIPDPSLAPLRAYLGETAGFDPARPFDNQASAEPSAQHGRVLQSLGQDLKKYLK